MMIHIKLLITTILWAGAFVAAKIITVDGGPFAIAFFRFCIASSVLFALVAIKGKVPKIPKDALLPIAGASFIGVFLYNYLYLAGIKYIEASRGAVIMSIVPIVVVLISRVTFKEQTSALKILGIIVSMIGAWVVVSRGNVANVLSGSLGPGEIMIMLCVLCAAGFTLFSKQILKSLEPMATMAYVSALSAVLLLVPAIIEMQYVPLQFMSTKFAMALTYLAIGPSVIGVVLYYDSIKAIGPSRASQYLNLMPVFGMILGFVFLGEQISSSLVIGGGLVTTGLYVTNSAT